MTLLAGVSYGAGSSGSIYRDSFNPNSGTKVEDESSKVSPARAILTRLYKNSAVKELFNDLAWASKAPKAGFNSDFGLVVCVSAGGPPPRPELEESVDPTVISLMELVQRQELTQRQRLIAEIVPEMRVIQQYIRGMDITSKLINELIDNYKNFHGTDAQHLAIAIAPKTHNNNEDSQEIEVLRRVEDLISAFLLGKERNARFIEIKKRNFGQHKNPPSLVERMGYIPELELLTLELSAELFKPLDFSFTIENKSNDTDPPDTGGAASSW